MADVYAVKSGNWSDTTLWNTGNLPDIIDDVYANTYTVYVDGDYQVNLLTNAAGTGITVGGRFILNDSVLLSASLILGGADLVPTVQFLSADPASATVYANLSGTTVFRPQAVTNSNSGTLTIYGSAVGATNNNSGTGAGVGYIQNISTGVLNVFGDIYGPTIGNTYYGISNTASGIVNIVGNLYSRMNETGGVNPYVVRNDSTGTVNVTGNIFGGQASGGIGLINASNGLVNILGHAYGGNGTIANRGADGVRNSSSGIINMIGDAYAGIGGHFGMQNASTTGTVNITGVCYGGLANGCQNTGTLNVVGGAIGGQATLSYGIQHTSNTAIVTLYGNVSGGAGTNANGIRNANAGTVNVIGNTYGGQGTSTPGIVNNSTGSINLTGNCYGFGYIPRNLNFAINGTGGYGIHNVAGGTVVVYGDAYSSNLRGDAWGIYNQGAGPVTVFGNAYGGASPNTGADGIRNLSTSTGTIILSGTAYGGSGLATAYGVSNLSTTAIVRVKRAAGNGWGLGYITALGANPGVFGSQTGSTFVEELELGPRGQWPTAGVIFFTPNTKATSMFETDTFQNYSLIQSNSADNLLPPVSSVRQGEVYNLGINTGACIIPSVNSVAAGALVDNSSGTAVLTPPETWNYPTTASDVDSMGGRLRNVLNINSANSLINSFNP